MNPLLGMQNMNSMMSFVSAMKGGNMNAILQMLTARNPQAAQIIQAARGKSGAEIEALCRNLCQQRGLDFDQVARQVQNMMRG
jgi:hypothetical protein